MDEVISGVEEATPPEPVDVAEAVPEQYFTVEYASAIINRSTDMIYRYIRDGVIETIQDPTDGRVRLIGSQELLKLLDQPKRGLRKRVVNLTLSDGTIIKKVIAMPKQKKEDDPEN